MTPAARTPASQPGNDALQAQITALGETMQQGINRIEKTLIGMDERLRSLENREAGCQPLINQRLDAAWRAIDELKAEIAGTKKTQQEDKTKLSKDIEALGAKISTLEFKMKLVTWVGGLAGSAIVLWLLNNWLGLIK